MRALADPTAAKTNKLTDRRGVASSTRNDGTKNAQTTPIYLAIDSLNAMDKAFADYAKEHPNDANRQKDWKTARSLLVDTFLDVDKKNTKSATFKNKGLAKITPTLVRLLRSQLLAHCPTSFSSPYATCDWAKKDLSQKLISTLEGPLASTGIELADTLRKDDVSRKELGKLVAYLLSSSSPGDTFGTVLYGAVDGPQAMQDSKNLDPFLKVMATALKASTYNAQGNVTERGMIDAQIALLSRMGGKAYDGEGKRVCSKELDPNNVVLEAMKNAVSPLPGSSPVETPLEVIMDAIADINRFAPSATETPRLDADDYGYLSNGVRDFLVNKERGLEQFYEIVRKGTAAP